MAIFHLKYRPQKISDLDLADVVEVFNNILGSEDMPQSFLFAGPKGAGKTSAARILARAVNCQNKEGVEPCGVCPNCKEISSGSSIDILEIDAASNRGIEDVRVLKDKAYLLPSKLAKKVFIIDEVHMMTKEAFNALLKLIEEPPKHTIFILCTTDPQKIPDTILSRLVRVDFRKGDKKELLKSLKRVVEGERIEAEDKVLDLIVEKSDGSFRNLHKALNEIVMGCGRKVDMEKVEAYFSGKGGDYNEEIFENDLKRKDVKAILEKLENMAQRGVNFVLFRERLIEYFQSKILAAYGIGEKKEGQLTVSEMVRLINLLILASRKERDVNVDQLPLELAVVEFVGDEGESGNGKERKKSKAEAEPKEPKREIRVKNKATKKVAERREIKREIVQSEVTVSMDMKEVEESWGNVLLAVKPYNHSVEAFLRAVRPKKIAANVLVVEVFYPFHKEKLEEVKNRKIVETGLKKVFGVDLQLECVLSKTRKKALVIDNNTPIEEISGEAEVKNENDGKDIYDVAKEIFG
ncbi:MAG: DNA polymerase III subunit gamma/tau [Patescibacteria group bacterium]